VQIILIQEGKLEKPIYVQRPTTHIVGVVGTTIWQMLGML